MFGQNREKKRFSWRWAVLLVALVAGSLLLAACGDSDPSPQRPLNLLRYRPPRTRTATP